MHIIISYWRYLHLELDVTKSNKSNIFKNTVVSFGERQKYLPIANSVTLFKSEAYKAGPFA